MLSNAYFLAKFRFDSAENEPAKNLQNNFRKMHFRKMHFSKNASSKNAFSWPPRASPAFSEVPPLRPPGGSGSPDRLTASPASPGTPSEVPRGTAAPRQLNWKLNNCYNSEMKSKECCKEGPCPPAHSLVFSRLQFSMSRIEVEPFADFFKTKMLRLERCRSVQGL